ncbi:MAG: Stp1/IreP family PP2C-type Ser/Thr phosphatase [Anaerolineae bacterium]
MKCPKCGVENRADAHFCQSCGAELPPPATSEREAAPETHPIPRPTNLSNPGSRNETVPLKEKDPPEHSGNAAANGDTAPLPDLSETFAPLPRGAILGDRYAVREVRATREGRNAYLAQDLVPARQCPQCGALTSDPQERFCMSCGADLSNVPSVNVRYLVRESADPQAFSVEAQLLGMKLEHPGLLMPVAVFQEAPYGPARHYRVEPEFPPPRAVSLSLPQEPNTVLEWGIMLAKALAHLHQHQITLTEIAPGDIAIDGKHAYWASFDQASIIPPESRPSARRYFARDLQGLASALFYLSTGKEKPSRKSQLPEEMHALLSFVIQNPSQTTAEDFARKLQGVLQKIRHPESISLVVGRRTDVGQVRSLNEDSLLTLDLAPVYRSLNQPVGVFLVADGMGGHEAGDVASQVTSRVIAQLATRKVLDPASSGEALPEPQQWLDEATRAANKAVYEERMAAGNDMGCTLVLALFIGATATLANVGDSRAYHLTPDTIQQVTVDHSLVERLVAAGQITREEAAYHPQKNVIYRVIGDKPQVEVDLYEQSLQIGEALLLCSDGLSGMISDQQIWQIWQRSTSPQEACDRMVEAANQAGGEDNVTVVIVQAEE